MREYFLLVRKSYYRVFLIASLFILLAANTAASLLAETECGVVRWSVKTGTDSDALAVDLDLPPTPTTISALVVIDPPEYHHSNPRSSPVETTVWVVNASLTGYKLEEEDSDYHLEISDENGNRMITEIPHPECILGDSPFSERIAKAREDFDQRFAVTTSLTETDVPVRVTGVGFFDFVHGHSAPNGIELHPVLDIVFDPDSSTGFVVYQVDALTAPVHSCPATGCSELMQLELGTLVNVVEIVPGDSIEGNADWLHIRIEDVDGYIHSLLAKPHQTGPVSTLEPTLSPTAATWTCNGDEFSCSSFATCDEVMSYFNACPGDPSRLDRNHDGVPCESCSN